MKGNILVGGSTYRTKTKLCWKKASSDGWESELQKVLRVSLWVARVSFMS
jgi:hypothetical protein